MDFPHQLTHVSTLVLTALDLRAEYSKERGNSTELKTGTKNALFNRVFRVLRVQFPDPTRGRE